MTPDGSPAVSVLMPVRNGARTLEAAVRSIFGQTLAQFELLVVDDGSDDATPGMLAGLRAGDSRLRVIRQEKLGLVAALNRGLGEAAAPLVARMDADDVAHPERLAAQAAFMARAPQVALLGTAFRVMAGSTPRKVVRPPAGDAELRAAMGRANALAHPSVMFRLEAVRQAGAYRPAFLHAEDYDLWLRVMDRHAASCLPDVLLDYSEHAGQVSWRGLEQRIYSEMGAVAAADRRQAGRTDLGVDAMPIDKARLSRMGMTADEIASGVMTRVLEAARQAQDAGFGRAMREAAQLGLALPNLPAQTKLRLTGLWLRGLATRN